jgi:hypothetical protein
LKSKIPKWCGEIASDPPWLLEGLTTNVRQFLRCTLLTILEMHITDNSYYEILAVLGIPQTTCSDIVQRFDERRDLRDRPQFLMNVAILRL